jgi:hypothetical protein
LRRVLATTQCTAGCFEFVKGLHRQSGESVMLVCGMVCSGSVRLQWSQ